MARNDDSWIETAQIIAVFVLLILVGWSCYQSGYDAGLAAT